MSTAPNAYVQRLQRGPILSTLLWLAWPNVLAMVLTVSVAVAETYYIGRLGTTPLAAMALVFPFAMLTQMMSAGSMGGGVSSAVSRALGAGDLPRAETLALNALAIGAVLGVIYSAIFLIFGPVFYRWLGGQGEVLAQATRYGAWMFSGALLVWLSNTLASVVRGSGNMRVPSVTIVLTAVLQITLGGVLGLGAGPVPSLGMPGVALGHVIATAASVLVFTGYLRSRHARVRLRWQAGALQRELLWDILKVGAVACLSPLQSVLAAVILTGLVARLGVEALAGYGIGQRLEFMLIPIAFGIGVASVPMVGMAIGAGLVARARRVAWTAAAVSAGALALIGLAVVLRPQIWSAIFSSDPGVLEAADLYLRTVGLAFPLFGLGLTLFFASQGSGKVLGPVLAGTVRLVLVGGVGAWLVAQAAGAGAFFGLVAGAMVAYGLSTAAAVWFTPWGAAPPIARHSAKPTS